MKFSKAQLFILSTTLLSAPLSAFALTPNPGQKTDSGLSAAENSFSKAGQIAYGEAAGNVDLETIVGNIIQVFLGLLGVIFMALALYGGYLWMTARGNEQMVDKAKDTIKNAVIGLAIILAAYAITQFVISALIGSTTAQAQP